MWIRKKWGTHGETILNITGQRSFVFKLSSLEKFSALEMSNLSEYYDVIVIGAGIIGSACGYHLAKSGQKTLALEQVVLLKFIFR